MLLTFTPNPCFEHTLRVSNFVPGRVHRIENSALHVCAGGKGINAARVASRFGTQTCALAPVGALQIAHFARLLKNEGACGELVPVAGDTRTTVNILHQSPENEGKTELIEAGVPLLVSEGTQILEKWAELLPKADLAAIGGSYPPSGAQFDFHAALLCQMAAQAGKKLIYDGKGRPFEVALRSKAPPWMIKPNLDEAAAFWKRDLASLTEEKRAVKDFLRLGVEIVLLSCGSRGAYLGRKSGIEWLAAPQIEVASSVGSGDSLVGAFAAKYLETGDVLEAARWGVAAGSANAAQFLSGFVGSEDAQKLVSQVKISTLEIALS